MPLFQIQVERQYLASITTNLTPIYEKYFHFFGNPDIQADILEVIACPGSQMVRVFQG